jgi:DnaA-homolog protein
MKNFQQLALDLCLRDDANFENFYIGNNSEIFNLLKNLKQSKNSQIIYLWGPKGCGKTHLLTACCQLLNSQTISYLPLFDYKNFSPNILENLENLSLLCLDDLDLIVGKKDWEEAIFAYYNSLFDSLNHSVMIISANSPPKNLNFFLPDLQSRLSNSLIFQIQSLDDSQKIAALQLRAKSFGLDLPVDTAKFLLNHYNRDMKQLIIILKKLDQAALNAKRKLTIPFIKAVL